MGLIEREKLHRVSANIHKIVLLLSCTSNSVYEESTMRIFPTGTIGEAWYSFKLLCCYSCHLLVHFVVPSRIGFLVTVSHFSPKGRYISKLHYDAKLLCLNLLIFTLLFTVTTCKSNINCGA